MLLVRATAVCCFNMRQCDYVILCILVVCYLQRHNNNGENNFIAAIHPTDPLALVEIFLKSLQATGSRIIQQSPIFDSYSLLLTHGNFCLYA